MSRASSGLARSKRPDLGTCVAAWLEHLALEVRASPHTVRAYASDAAVLFDEVGVTAGVDEFTQATLRRALARQYGLSAATAARWVSAMRSLGRYLVWRGWLPDSPAELVRRPKVGLPPPPWITEDEMATLCEVRGARRDRPIEMRDVALVEVLYGAGLRVSEAVALDVEDVRPDDDGALVRVRRGKGGRDRVAVLGRPGVAAIQRWLVYRCALAPASEAALFVTYRGGRLSDRGARQAIYARSEARLGRRYGPHALRHAIGSHLLQRGMDLRLVAEMLGHVSVRSTVRYTLVDLGWLFEQYAKAHPRAGDMRRHWARSSKRQASALGNIERSAACSASSSDAPQPIQTSSSSPSTSWRTRSHSHPPKAR